ncbi:fimbria/pilus outer membrane usher protein [Klebsiella oxytoca]|uniref:fimbria/pilus outer membrane usher protein n=1 Tax=Klebsiella oxytoca TaxID=571 RepID=UPI00384ABF1C
MPLSDARRLNLLLDDMPVSGGDVELRKKKDFSYTYDSLNQALLITADRSRLAGAQRLHNSKNARIIREDQLSPEVSGVALNYNLFASHSDADQYLTAYTELRTFGVGPGYFSGSFNSRFSDKSYPGENTGTTRLMTYWNRENIDKLLTLTVGDNYTASQSWSNSVRFGGITLAHNYTLQPGINTSARDILTDTVTVPSTVDLYIQGIKTSSQQVEPGQFTLNTAPILSGTGSAQVVITDMNGQQRVVDLALYGTNRLLSPGLDTWALNAGWVREDYGYRSFSYDPDVIGVGDWRYGVSNRLTLEAHAEQGEKLNNMGGGVNYLLSPALGLIHGDMALGRYRDDTGSQWGAGWQWNNRFLNLALNHTRRDAQFRDISALVDNTLATRRDSAFVSWSLPVLGTLGASWINQQYSDQEMQYVGLSWSKSFGRRAIVSTSFTRSLEEDRNKTFYVNITVPLFSDNRDYLTLQHNQNDNKSSGQIGLNHTLESRRPGWGWNASARSGDSDNLHASLLRRNTWSDMELGYNRYSSQTDYYAAMSGAVGLFMGDLYATRELGDAFLLVDTRGVADIPVRFEHRVVGKTDSNGHLFLTSLLPYQNNSVDIDALNLPADYRAPYTSQMAIPRRGSGALIRFDITRVTSLMLNARDARGQPLPFAAAVSVTDNPGKTVTSGTSSTVVGYDGAIYLENPPAGGHVLVRWDDGQCAITLPEVIQPGATVSRRNVKCL